MRNFDIIVKIIIVSAFCVVFIAGLFFQTASITRLHMKCRDNFNAMSTNSHDEDIFIPECNQEFDLVWIVLLMQIVLLLIISCIYLIIH